MCMHYQAIIYKDVNAFTYLKAIVIISIKIPCRILPHYNNITFYNNNKCAQFFTYCMRYIVHIIYLPDDKVLDAKSTYEIPYILS